MLHQLHDTRTANKSAGRPRKKRLSSAELDEHKRRMRQTEGINRAQVTADEARVVADNAHLREGNVSLDEAHTKAEARLKRDGSERMSGTLKLRSDEDPTFDNDAAKVKQVKAAAKDASDANTNANGRLSRDGSQRMQGTLLLRNDRDPSDPDDAAKVKQVNAAAKAASDAHNAANDRLPLGGGTLKGNTYVKAELSADQQWLYFGGWRKVKRNNKGWLYC